MIAHFNSLEATQQAVRGMSPMGDIVTTDDVAAAVAFHASNDARMITCADLVIDGGRLIQQSLPHTPTPASTMPLAVRRPCFLGIHV